MTLTPRTAHDARYRPQPGDTYTYSNAPDALVHTVTAVDSEWVYLDRECFSPEKWSLDYWDMSPGVWTPAPACLTCAKSRSRKGACGDVPADPTACLRYYPRTGA